MPKKKTFGEKFYIQFKEKSVPKIAFVTVTVHLKLLWQTGHHILFFVSQKLININTAPQYMLNLVSTNAKIG